MTKRQVLTAVFISMGLIGSASSIISLSSCATSGSKTDHRALADAKPETTVFVFDKENRIDMKSTVFDGEKTVLEISEKLIFGLETNAQNQVTRIGGLGIAGGQGKFFGWCYAVDGVIPDKVLPGDYRLFGNVAHKIVWFYGSVKKRFTKSEADLEKNPCKPSATDNAELGLLLSN